MTGNERYTLEEDLAIGLKLQGIEAFDLDPAACEEAHCAPIWYDKAKNGLAQPWFGHVWVNPPFSECERWVRRAWQAANEPAVKSVTMLLPGGRTEQPWWQDMIEPFRDGRDGASAPFELTVHFMRGRTRFGFPGNVSGEGVGSPPFVCVMLIFKRRAV